MAFELLPFVGGAFLIGVALTAWVRRWAIARRVIDVPNLRSSHSEPTPRGGGVATVVAATAVLGVAALQGLLALDVFMALTVGGLAVAGVGFVDDRRPLPPKIRLLVHVAAALCALLWLGGLPPLLVGGQLFTFGWGGYVLGVLGIVWTLNLFNFMDGIDGIAGSEAVFIATVGVIIHALTDTSVDLPVSGSIFAAACAGFLVWNWPPAKIFMGDVGSGYMGYMIAVLAIVAARSDSVALLIWVILGGGFFVDATMTLTRRVARGERASEAHRSHAYQVLSRRWRSHRAVTLTLVGINCGWLAPCAFFASRHPNLAGWALLVALAPLAIAAFLGGAGEREDS